MPVNVETDWGMVVKSHVLSQTKLLVKNLGNEPEALRLLGELAGFLVTAVPIKRDGPLWKTDLAPGVFGAEESTQMTIERYLTIASEEKVQFPVEEWALDIEGKNTGSRISLRVRTAHKWKKPRGGCEVQIRPGEGNEINKFLQI